MPRPIYRTRIRQLRWPRFGGAEGDADGEGRSEFGNGNLAMRDTAQGGASMPTERGDQRAGPDASVQHLAAGPEQRGVSFPYD